LTIEQVLTTLAETPPRLAALTAGLAPAQLLAAPSSGAWSARDVLAHLCACSDMWGKYMRMIIAEDRPTYRGVNPRAWIKKTDYLEQEFQPLFQAYAAQRTELLAVLQPLPPAGWTRTGTVIDMVGKQFERTVYYYAHWLAHHERPHIKQMERIVNTVRV